MPNVIIVNAISNNFVVTISNNFVVTISVVTISQFPYGFVNFYSVPFLSSDMEGAVA